MNKPDYGVIVGRFQVNDLHDGQLELFSEVRARHNRVIVFIGVSPTEITRTHPLDFETRKKMIQGKFPEFTILPIKDVHSDKLWSEMLDAKIREVADYGDVTLYGGRDSFIPHYKGEFKPRELNLHSTASGAQVRASLTNKVIDSSDFRAGIIYAANNMRPRVFPTVDIIIARQEYEKRRSPLHVARGIPDSVMRIKILLAQKPGETKWRFVGGFAEPLVKSYEEDAKREAYEETRLDINSLQYIGSTIIEDWRYAKDPDAIKTMVFIGWTATQLAEAHDDIDTVAWFDSEDITIATIIPDHQPILQLFTKAMSNQMISGGSQDASSVLP